MAEEARRWCRVLVAAALTVAFATMGLLGAPRTESVALAASHQPVAARSTPHTPKPDPPQGGHNGGGKGKKKSKAPSPSAEPPPPPAPIRAVPVAPVAPVARVAPAPPVVPGPPPATVVSLTFDDGIDNQMAGAAILERYGLKGTFYVNSGAIDSPGHMTLSDLNTLVAEGHEVGGHTTNHVPLSSTPPAEAMRQICDDRATLVGWGFRVRSFAYPFSLFDDGSVRAVKQCGYSSARTTGDLREPYDPACAECDLTEPVPPVDPFRVRTPGEVLPNWKVSDLERLVIQAAHNGGGWVPLVFHQVCDGCTDIATRAQTLESFAVWLSRSAPPGTIVKTVGDVIGGPPGIVRTAPVSTVTSVSNPSLEQEPVRSPDTADSAGSEDAPEWRPDIPLCWQTGGYGHNSASFARSRDAHLGTWAERLDVADYSDGDAKLLTRMDLGGCAPELRPGESYILSSWYKSTSRTQYSVYYRTESGSWKYWTSSPWFDPASGWTEATWATPPAPLDARGLSFGLGLASAGTLLTDDYSLVAVSSPGLVSPAGKLLLALTGGIVGAILVISIVQHFKGRARRRRAAAAEREAEDDDESPRVLSPTNTN